MDEATHPLVGFLQDLQADDTLPQVIRDRAEELEDRYGQDVQEHLHE